LDGIAEGRLIVTDVGSVKGSLCRWVSQKKWKRVEFTGAHPMVGSHERGWEASRTGLYEGGLVFIIRASRPAPSFRDVKNFWSALAGRVVTLGAEEHDRLVSRLSHLPHAVAACLMLAAGSEGFEMAGPGFRDSTRVAASHESVWIPIFMENRRAILAALREFQKRTDCFVRALKSGDSRELCHILRRARGLRQEI
jgi:prephenate dehydrogenase